MSHTQARSLHGWSGRSLLGLAGQISRDHCGFRAVGCCWTRPLPTARLGLSVPHGANTLGPCGKRKLEACSPQVSKTGMVGLRPLQ